MAQVNETEQVQSAINVGQFSEIAQIDPVVKTEQVNEIEQVQSAINEGQVSEIVQVDPVVKVAQVNETEQVQSAINEGQVSEIAQADSVVKTAQVNAINQVKPIAPSRRYITLNEIKSVKDMDYLIENHQLKNVRCELLNGIGVNGVAKMQQKY